MRAPPRDQSPGVAVRPLTPLSHGPSAGLIFYDTKVTVMNRVLNATVQRTADHAAPEITLDPLEIVGGRSGCGEQTLRNAGACAS